MSVVSFEKLKSKYMLSAALKSAVMGISAGLLAVGAVLLPLKLCAISLHFAYYILIGAGVCAAVFTPFFLILKPNDKKLAKKLDKEYSLDERVQTLVEYSQRQGEMIELQREDASRRLEDLPKRKIKFGRIWYLILIPVLSTALFLTAVSIPSKVKDDNPPVVPTDPNIPPPSEDEDVYWEYDVYLRAAMTELFWNISDSSLADAEKTEVLNVWTVLDEQLGTIFTEREMKAAVLSAIAEIDSRLNGANTFRAVRGGLSAAGEESISAALIKAVAAYLSSGLDFTEISHVNSVETLLNGYLETSLGGDFEKLKPSFKINQEDGLKDFLDGYALKIKTALTDSEIWEDDAIYTALSGFVTQLSAISGKVNKGYGNNTLHGEIDTAFATLKGNLMTALKPQSYRCMLDEFIRKKLASIFGVSLTELPSGNEDLLDFISDGDGGDDVTDPGNNENGGGYGDGEQVYGADDKIYDPATGTYVRYGDILNAYADRLADDTGNMPTDLKTFIEEYFNILHNGTKDESQK